MADFVWGGGGAQMTPERIAAERKVAQALMERGMDYSPVQHVTQGLSRVAQAVMGGLDYRAANDAEKANIAADQEMMKSWFPGATPAAPAVPVSAVPARPVGDGAMALNQAGQPVTGADGGIMPPGAAPPDYRSAIASIESAGQKNPYAAMGPVTAAGDRAHGRYQVMGANIGPWTEAALGRRLTPEQFLADPAAQDQVFDHRFGSYVKQTGNPQDAASMWFSGRPMAGNTSQDQLGTSVPTYVQKFTKALGPSTAQAAPAEDPAALPPNATPTAAVPPGYVIPGQSAAAPTGPAGLNPSIIRALTSPYTSEGTKKVAQIMLQHQMSDKVQYQTLPDGTILQLDPMGRAPPKIAYQGPTKPTFGVIGKDRYSNDVHGFIDPIRQGVSPVSVPQNATPGSDAANPDVTGEPFLSTLPKPQADQIKGITEGRISPPGAFALKTPYWQKMMSDVAQYEPGFDLTKWGARSATAKDFASGKSAQNITAFNTAIQHLDTLDKAAVALDNYNLTPINTVKNIISSKTGDPAIKNFEVAKTAVADELTRAFRGSGGNVHDLVQWENAINASNSPAQLKGAIKQAVELLRGRIESLGDTYNRGMNTKTEAVKLLSPKAQEAIGRLSGETAVRPTDGDAGWQEVAPGVRIREKK